MKGFAQRGNSKLGDDCRKLNFERVQKGKPLCVLGRDVTLDMVPTLVQRSLVGKFKFIKISRNKILDWIREKWKPCISNIPRNRAPTISYALIMAFQMVETFLEDFFFVLIHSSLDRG